MKTAFALVAIALCLQNVAFGARSLSQLPVLTAPAPAPGPSSGNISCALAALQQAGTFNTLLELIAASSEADEFTDLLSSDSERATVFAPTDSGIEKVAASLGDLDAIMSNPDLLTSIIMYHILPSQLAPQDLQDQYSFNTLYEINDVAQSVAIQGNGVTATIVAANSTAPIVSSLTACEFEVYPIDGVLLPNSS